MSKLFTGKIDLTKIDKSKIFTGKKGKYVDVTIWINDEPDQYGNSMSIQQSTKKGDSKIYIGNCKEFGSDQETPSIDTNKDQESDGPEDLPF